MDPEGPLKCISIPKETQNYYYKIQIYKKYYQPKHIQNAFLLQNPLHTI